MRELAYVALGFVAGAIVVARLRENESACCKRVSAGIREHVTDQFGDWGGWLYDESGIGSVAPSLLDTFGVP